MITSCLSISPQEEARLRALEKYPFELETAEKQFDDITELAAMICNKPTAYISIVELDKQRFKAKVGIDLNETMRDISFCQYTIRRDEVLEIEDATQHELFAANPLVLGDPHIRFYAGAPLITPDGYRLGTLSVTDTKPGKLTRHQRQALVQLSKLVTELFEIKRREKENLQARQRAEEAVRTKAGFLASMSHEIRTPLSGIMGITSMLAQDNPAAHQLDYLDTLKTSALNLLEFMNDVLDFSKLDAGLVHFENIPFSVTDVFASLQKQYKQRAAAKSLELSFTADHTIPENLSGDSFRLTEILGHLTREAIHTVTEGAIHIHATRVEQTASTVIIRFQLQDTRQQASVAQSQGLLGIEQRSVTNATSQLIAMMTVRRLLELMGTTVQLNSQPAIGTTLTFDLIFSLFAQKTNVTPTIRMATESSAPLGSYRILMAEDNPVNALIAKKIIQQWGPVVDTVENGVQALEKIQEHAYDIILMDLEMPQMGGLEATRRIREAGGHHAHVPIVALTASVSDISQSEALAAGMNDYIVKPFNPEELLTTLKKLLPFHDQSRKAG